MAEKVAPSKLRGKIFRSEELVPEAWQVHGADVWTFNPAILRDGDGWIMAYRVVIAGDLRRRIAMCRLSDDFAVQGSSVIVFSDLVRFAPEAPISGQATTWFADPRLYRLGGRHFLYWNSGWHEPANHQFLQEFDPETLRPVGRPREMTLSGRRALEKNWMLFGDGPFHAVYSVDPHRVLEFELCGNGPMEFREAATVSHGGGYARLHGGLRGGAPPQKAGDSYISFCHSIHGEPGDYRYEIAAYRFEASPPFRPAAMPTGPVGLPAEFRPPRTLPKLNSAVGQVLYPAGAQLVERDWVLSYGLNDERCCIVVIPEADVAATMTSIRDRGSLPPA